MINQTAYELGSNRSCIRELFEYGNRRAAIVGRENIFDYSLGNPSIPSPKEVNDAIREVLTEIRDTAGEISKRMSRVLEPAKAPKTKGQER